MSRALLFLGLIASLGANVGLALRWKAATAEQTASRAEAAQVSSRVAPAKSSDADPGASLAADFPRTREEVQALRQRLERAGLPPEVIRAVLMFSLHREFDRRRRELVGGQNPDEYWRNRPPRDDLATQTALRELNLEQRKMARALGVEDFPDFDREAERRQFGNLAPEKIARMKKIFADYEDLEGQLFVEGADRNSPAMRSRAELLAREKRADIERLLTPQELLDYDYRNSQAGHRLRGMFGQFQATEAEFVAAFPALQRVLTDSGLEGANRAGNMAEMRRIRETLDKNMEAAMRQALGEARFAEMKEANDQTLRQTREFAASLNLPANVAAQVVAVQREFAPQLSAVDRDRDLTPNQRDAKASALALEARERLIGALGPENFEAYKRRGGGWLGAALNRRPPTPSPAATSP